jgi:hypothetical protein
MNAAEDFQKTFASMPKSNFIFPDFMHVSFVRRGDLKLVHCFSKKTLSCFRFKSFYPKNILFDVVEGFRKIIKNSAVNYRTNFFI